MDAMRLVALDAEVLEVTLVLGAAACAAHALKTPGGAALAAIQGTDVGLVGGSGANMGKRGGAAAHRAAQGPDMLERPLLDLAAHAGKLGLSNGLKLAAQGKRQHHAGETHALEGLVRLALLVDDVVGDGFDPTLGVLPRQVDGLELDNLGPTQALEVTAGVFGEGALLDEV